MRTTQMMRNLWPHNCDQSEGEWYYFENMNARAFMHQELCGQFGAMWALEQCFEKYNYYVRKEDTGGYNCRPITGGTGTSLHAHMIAIDVNWRTNPYGSHLVTDMPKAMINEIEGIRTMSGAQVWRWGGDWNNNEVRDDPNYDAMHFEIQCSRTELATGISLKTVPYTPPKRKERTMVAVTFKMPVLAIGDKGEDVTRLQKYLQQSGYDVYVDGGFGPETEQTIKDIQAFFGIRLLQPGVVEEQTWANIIYIHFMKLFPT